MLECIWVFFCMLNFFGEVWLYFSLVCILCLHVKGCNIGWSQCQHSGRQPYPVNSWWCYRGTALIHPFVIFGIISTLSCWQPIRWHSRRLGQCIGVRLSVCLVVTSRKLEGHSIEHVPPPRPSSLLYLYLVPPVPDGTLGDETGSSPCTMPS